MVKKEVEKLLRKVQKPARYTGGELNSVVKDKKSVDLRFAFCFPDHVNPYFSGPTSSNWPNSSFKAFLLLFLIIFL